MQYKIQIFSSLSYTKIYRVSQGFLCVFFVAFLGHFWCSVVTSVTLSINLSNFERKNAKKAKKAKRKKIGKDLTSFFNLKNTQTSQMKTKKKMVQ